MDLIAIDGRVVVAGPDTTAVVAAPAVGPLVGLRFRPGVLPRLLGVPAGQLAGQRVPLDELRDVTRHPRDLTALTVALAAEQARRETAPWPLTTLHHVTRRFDAGAPVAGVAEEIGWSARTMQRQCEAVYGYGPAMLRRVLRFRRAVAMLRAGHPAADTAAASGYADQPHLHREVRTFAGITVGEVHATG
jgi:AraC-like DNA-binding protein